MRRSYRLWAPGTANADCWLDVSSVIRPAQRAQAVRDVSGSVGSSGVLKQGVTAVGSGNSLEKQVWSRRSEASLLQAPLSSGGKSSTVRGQKCIWQSHHMYTFISVCTRFNFCFQFWVLGDFASRPSCWFNDGVNQKPRLASTHKHVASRHVSA